MATRKLARSWSTRKMRSRSWKEGCTAHYCASVAPIVVGGTHHRYCSNRTKQQHQVRLLLLPHHTLLLLLHHLRAGHTLFLCPLPMTELLATAVNAANAHAAAAGHVMLIDEEVWGMSSLRPPVLRRPSLLSCPSSACCCRRHRFGVKGSLGSRCRGRRYWCIAVCTCAFCASCPRQRAAQV